MRAKHLKGWLVAYNRGKLAVDKGEEKTKEEEEGGEHWEKLWTWFRRRFEKGRWRKRLLVRPWC